jgi:2',3'-cyclic-nucleotide 2'-phosphodiesterase (5'-nucleotidase family)
MTIGNHEFDWGEEYIESNLELADFPFLAINVYDRATDTLADYCTPSVTVECGAATIGIIGAIGDCYSSISGDKVENIYFKTGEELNSLICAESDRLRSNGADFILLSIHDGSADIDLSKEHVDLVFEGHTHKSYVRPDKHGVYHLQGGGDNDGIVHVEAVINVAGGESIVKTAEFISADVYDNSPSDSIVEDLMKKYASEVAKADEVLGKNSALRSGDWLRALVARLYLEKGIEEWGKKYDIVLGGGYLSVRAPYNLSIGEVKYSDLQSIFPFDNTLDLCSVKGSDLKSKFINTSNSNYFVYYGDYGQSVRFSIDDNATYYIIVDSYTSHYAPNRLTVIDSLGEGLYARDLLADHIKNGGLE